MAIFIIWVALPSNFIAMGTLQELSILQSPWIFTTTRSIVMNYACASEFKSSFKLHSQGGGRAAVIAAAAGSQAATSGEE